MRRPPTRQAYEYEIHTAAGNRTNLTFTVPQNAASGHSNQQQQPQTLPPTHVGVWGDMGTVAPLGFKVRGVLYSSSESLTSLLLLFRLLLLLPLLLLRLRLLLRLHAWVQHFCLCFRASLLVVPCLAFSASSACTQVFDKVLADHRLGGSSRFNLTMLFGDIAYAGLDTSVEPLNITKADELEYVWDLFGVQVRCTGVCTLSAYSWLVRARSCASCCPTRLTTSNTRAYRAGGCCGAAQQAH